MVGCRAWVFRCAPAGFRRHPEDVLGDVFVAVLGGLGSPFGQNRRMALLEGVGDVFQKDEAQDDVLVFGGVHAAAQGVCHAPKLGLIARGGAVAAGLCVRVRAGFSRLCACHSFLFLRLSMRRQLLPALAAGTTGQPHGLTLPWLSRHCNRETHRCWRGRNPTLPVAARQTAELLRSPRCYLPAAAVGSSRTAAPARC